MSHATSPQSYSNPIHATVTYLYTNHREHHQGLPRVGCVVGKDPGGDGSVAARLDQLHHVLHRRSHLYHAELEQRIADGILLLGHAHFFHYHLESPKNHCLFFFSRFPFFFSFIHPYHWSFITYHSITIFITTILIITSMDFLSIFSDRSRSCSKCTKTGIRWFGLIASITDTGHINFLVFPVSLTQGSRKAPANFCWRISWSDWNLVKNEKKIGREF